MRGCYRCTRNLARVAEEAGDPGYLQRRWPVATERDQRTRCTPDRRRSRVGQPRGGQADVASRYFKAPRNGGGEKVHRSTDTQVNPGLGMRRIGGCRLTTWPHTHSKGAWSAPARGRSGSRRPAKRATGPLRKRGSFLTDARPGARRPGGHLVPEHPLRSWADGVEKGCLGPSSLHNPEDYATFSGYKWSFGAPGAPEISIISS